MRLPLSVLLLISHVVIPLSDTRLYFPVLPSFLQMQNMDVMMPFCSSTYEHILLLVLLLMTFVCLELKSRPDRALRTQSPASANCTATLTWHLGDDVTTAWSLQSQCV